MRRHGMQELQWNRTRLEDMHGVPWEPIPGRGGIEIMPHAPIHEREDEPRRTAEPADNALTMMISGIRQHDVMDFGGTPGCPGCIAREQGHDKTSQ